MSFTSRYLSVRNHLEKNKVFSEAQHIVPNIESKMQDVKFSIKISVGKSSEVYFHYCAFSFRKSFFFV